LSLSSDGGILKLGIQKYFKVFTNFIHTLHKAAVSLQRRMCCFCWEKYCLRKKNTQLLNWKPSVNVTAMLSKVNAERGQNNLLHTAKRSSASIFCKTW